MSLIKREEHIYENRYYDCFEYILDKNELFSNTDYKILQGQDSSRFVKNIKIMKNGKITLFYLSEGYCELSSMLEYVTQEELMVIITNLLSGIIVVKQNGFLACQNIDVSWDKVYVEKGTNEVRLVYIPIIHDARSNCSEFECDLRNKIVEIITTHITKYTENIKTLIEELEDMRVSLELICNRMKQMEFYNHQIHRNMNKDEMNICMISLDGQEDFKIKINKTETLLGKKKELVDEVIPFNNMISRKHCKIICNTEGVYISDVGSVNGTYVNNVRVKVGELKRIKKGDIIRLANSNFEIV